MSEALWLSLRLATVVSVLLLIVGLPIAYWIAFSRRKWKFLVEAVVALPIVLPPTVLGFYLLLLMGSNGALGQFWMRWTGHPLAFTFSALVIGSVIYSLPFAVQPFAAAFSAVDPALLAAAATLGASRWRRFCTITLPLSRAGVLGGVGLSFAHTLGEFGVVLMLGGNIEGATRTASIAIFDNVQALDYASANHDALVLLAISFVLLTAIYRLNRRSLRGWSLQ
ncbi:MAG TPA: molybdate ABC transporter permease subunit [Candidatus Acidoferrales bacterium]|nr:molybdate ABC transporter permease subunit [Candidatus Acidoferrales bacterium]